MIRKTLLGMTERAASTCSVLKYPLLMDVVTALDYVLVKVFVSLKGLFAAREPADEL